jgi:alpha-L-arabinofuranosidase
MLRRRLPLVGITVGILLAGTLTTMREPAYGAPAPVTTDYTLRVDATGRGPTIDDTMYGIFLEDINRAADGGLYAELVDNRSFEYDPADNASFRPLTAWTPSGIDGGTGQAQVLDDAGRLNERNRRYLQLDLRGNTGGYGVVNAGYNTGIAVTAGKRYDFSVWARSAEPGGTVLSVRLGDAAGAELAAPLRIRIRGDQWRQYRGSVRARTTSTTGRLGVFAAGTGTVSLDMVSLFPRETYRGRPNGLRKDLGEKIAALKPGFLRFPGGCLVNTGSHAAYEAPNWERRRSYQWKDTIGPVEQRATNANFWGYNQSYGLGYYEYFQFAEDIGAMPLPVVPALVTGCGQNRATDDPALLQRHVQDTLDLIEFANGPATSTWGRVRARMGHPKPFGLTHLGVGNEENLPDAFFERFTVFRSAIEARYPDITIVSNSGPDDTGATFNRLWQLNRAAGVDMVDEHYYNSPTWFLRNNERYDSYDRNGPKVFLGEFASGANTFFNALSEAAYMTGLERNADVVKLASYAPLLANEDYVQWRPDLIWLNNHTSWGSTSYEVQKLFMNNVGDQVVPSSASGTPVPPMAPITGAVGLSTWATSAAYDDVEVTAADGTALLSDDFSGDASQWTHLSGRGSWSIQDGAFVQSDTTATDTMMSAGDPGWQNYDLNVKATKRAGAEGFLIAFGVQDTGNFFWWNLGGWNNTQSAIEKATNGGKETLIANGTAIETGRTYDISIQVRGRQVTLFLDGQQWGTFVDDAFGEPFRQVVTRDWRTGDLILKVVNAQEAAARTSIDLGRRVRLGRTAEVTTLQGAPNAVNSADARLIAPQRSRLRGITHRFNYTFPAYSVTFIRLRAR